MIIEQFTAAPFRIAARLVSGSLLPLLAVLGMLLMPVSCTCGAQVPHGHSLFQLPHHHHGAYDAAGDAHSAVEDVSHAHHVHGGKAAVPAGLKGDADCDGAAAMMSSAQFTNVALQNVMEKGDGAVVKGPPTSSVGQPMTFAQPALIPLPVACSNPLALPGVRQMHGTITLPETPPPQSIA
jgi:hypothetical protein